MEGWSRVFIEIMGHILYQNDLVMYLFIKLYRIVTMALTCENVFVFNEHRITSFFFLVAFFKSLYLHALLLFCRDKVLHQIFWEQADLSATSMLTSSVIINYTLFEKRYFSVLETWQFSFASNSCHRLNSHFIESHHTNPMFYYWVHINHQIHFIQIKILPKI